MKKSTKNGAKTLLAGASGKLIVSKCDSSREITEEFRQAAMKEDTRRMKEKDDYDAWRAW